MEYTVSDLKKADRLYDEMSLLEVADETGIPYGTLSSWSRKGWIGTETNHYKGPKRYTWEKVDRANRLYDRISLPAVADVLGVPLTTLQGWKDREWITSDVDWNAKARKRDFKASPKRAVELVRGQDLSYSEAADEMGVGKTTIYRYLKHYENGNI